MNYNFYKNNFKIWCIEKAGFDHVEIYSFIILFVFSISKRTILFAEQSHLLIRVWSKDV